MASSTSQLSPFRFTDFTASTGTLIAEYAAPSPGPSSRAGEEGDPQAQAEAVQKAWTEVWKSDLEAERFILPLLWGNRACFSVGMFQKQPFSNATHCLFVDMAKAPRERQFLDVLSKALIKERNYVFLQEAQPVDLFTEMFLSGVVGPLGSCAYKHSKDDRYVSVRICLADRRLFLFQDAKGALHQLPISARRVLSHELLHVHQMLVGSLEQLQKQVPQTRCWSNNAEMMAIRGYGKGQQQAKFSENGFARARHEMERVSHMCVPALDTLPKEAQFMLAFRMGLNGTVNVQLNQSLVGQTYREVWMAQARVQVKELAQGMVHRVNTLANECLLQRLGNRFASSSSSAAMAASEPARLGQLEEVFLNLLAKPMEEEIAQLNVLDFRMISDEEIVRAYWEGFPDLKFTTEQEDVALKAKMHQGREAAFYQILGFLSSCGQEKRVQNIQAFLEDREKLRAKHFAEMQERLKPLLEQLKPIGEMLEKFRKEHLDKP